MMKHNQFGNEEIRALSWKQPFATAMLHGKIETRTWNTDYRGLVLICTSKASYDEATAIRICGELQFIRMCRVISKDMDTLDLEGYAIAVGRLVDCQKMKPDDEDKTFVKYRNDLYCHVYEDIKPIEPFAWKGSQGWRKLDRETISKIKFI